VLWVGAPAPPGIFPLSEFGVSVAAFDEKMELMLHPGNDAAKIEFSRRSLKKLEIVFPRVNILHSLRGSIGKNSSHYNKMLKYTQYVLVSVF